MPRMMWGVQFCLTRLSDELVGFRFSVHELDAWDDVGGSVV